MNTTRNFLISISLLVSACTAHDYNSAEWLKSQSIRCAEEYINKEVRNSRKEVLNNGSILYSAGKTRCLIEPSGIVTGTIDSDTIKDAIVTISTFSDEQFQRKDHLILLNNKERLEFVKEYRDEMKIVSIRNREITIETSHIASDSPIGDCQACKVYRTYRFENGDTVRIR